MNRLDNYDQYKELSCDFDDISLLNGYVLVEVDLNLTTDSGLIVPFAGSLTESYDRVGHCIRSGIVRKFSTDYMYDGKNQEYLWKSRIEIEENDIVWFDHVASIDSLKIFNKGKLYYVLPYYSLYVAKRKIDAWKTDVIMLNGYTLVQEIDNYDGYFITLYKDKRNPIVEVKHTGSNNDEYLDGEGYDTNVEVGDRYETFHYTMIKLEDDNHLSFNGDEKYYVIQKRRFIYKH
jgi:sRNA-binding regulator protein Hfq